MKALVRLSSISLLFLALGVASVPFSTISLAQNTSATTSSALSPATIKALQEALNKQGIAVKTDGVLSEETRAAIKKYQSQHHLPVTGEADKATLDKLGVATTGATPASTTASSQTAATEGAGPSTQDQAQSSPGASGTGPGMMSGPMMQQGMMQGMMQTMQGMMGMMQGQMQPGTMPQQGQMQPGSMPGRMGRPQEQGTLDNRTATNCPMMSGSGQMTAPAMMQMMQGMMQMMQMMQNQMQQPSQKS